jgi:tetratricopeptide (TPR) repeat protein
MMGIGRGIAIAAVVCAAVAPAYAMTEEEERAKAHFLAGQSYYDQASYADALREFNEAYRISKRPALLYNIARCHEALDQYADAVEMLERYLKEEPGTADRAAIETRIANLKGRAPVKRVHPEREPAQVSPPAAKTQTSTPTVTERPAPTPTPTQTPTTSHRRIWTWVVGGVGAGLLVAALGTGVASQVDFNNLGNACGGNRCDASQQGNIDRGKGLAIATDLLWPVGAAAVGVGIVLFFVEGRHERARGVAVAH